MSGIAEAERRTLSALAVIARSREGGAEPAFLGPEAALAFMRLDHERVNRVVREANITAD